MADEKRETHVKRLKSRDDDSIFVDVERVDSWIFVRGKGGTYQKTTFIYDWAPLEAMEDDAEPNYDKEQEVGGRKFKWIKLKNPDDDSQFVPCPALTEVTVKTGKGGSYQKTIVTINNEQDNETRKVRERDVYHGTDLDPKDPSYPEDPQKSENLDRSQRLRCEVIDQFTIKRGSGGSFQRRLYDLENSDKVQA